MHPGLQKAKRIAVTIYLIALHGVLVFFIGERVIRRYTVITPVENASVSDPSDAKPIPTPIPVPEEFADPVDANVNSNVQAVPMSSPGLSTSGPGLMIPVAGVRPDQLIDTFTASRSDNRLHDAIDIIAPAGTPVVAAADGEIVKFFDSERGGITIYQLTADRKFVLYYAHLLRRADGLTVGMRVQKGTTIGYVGDTGNAGAGNYHLHFSVAIVTDPKRFWSGTYLNPYPLLVNGTYPTG